MVASRIAHGQHQKDDVRTICNQMPHDALSIQLQVTEDEIYLIRSRYIMSPFTRLKGTEGHNGAAVVGLLVYRLHTASYYAAVPSTSYHARQDARYASLRPL